MKFARNAQLFHGQLDASPFVGVLFLLAIILLLNSSLVFTPGVPIRLPEAGGFAGATNVTVTVAVDGRGQFYFQNQLTQEKDLRNHFAEAVRRYRSPVTLVVMADQGVPIEILVRLTSLARATGIRDAVLATRPPRASPPPDLGL